MVAVLDVEYFPLSPFSDPTRLDFVGYERLKEVIFPYIKQRERHYSIIKTGLQNITRAYISPSNKNAPYFVKTLQSVTNYAPLQILPHLLLNTIGM